MDARLADCDLPLGKTVDSIRATRLTPDHIECGFMFHGPVNSLASFLLCRSNKCSFLRQGLTGKVPCPETQYRERRYSAMKCMSSLSGQKENIQPILSPNGFLDQTGVDVYYIHPPPVAEFPRPPAQTCKYVRVPSVFLRPLKLLNPGTLFEVVDKK